MLAWLSLLVRNEEPNNSRILWVKIVVYQCRESNVCSRSKTIEVK